MRLTLAYGADGLEVDVPDDAVVVGPQEPPGRWPTRPERCARHWPTRSSGPALGDLIGPEGRIAVVFPDLTRPMPNTTVLPPLLAELERAGAGPDRVELLCATGTHRQATRTEMEELVGAAVARRYRIHDHRLRRPAAMSGWGRWTVCRSCSTATTSTPTSAS